MANPLKEVAGVTATAVANKIRLLADGGTNSPDTSFQRFSGSTVPPDRPPDAQTNAAAPSARSGGKAQDPHPGTPHCLKARRLQNSDYYAPALATTTCPNLSDAATRVTLDTFREIWLDKVADGFVVGQECRFEVAYVISRNLHPRTLTAVLSFPELGALACMHRCTAHIYARQLVAERHLEFTPGNGRGRKSVFRPLTRRPYVIIQEGR